MPKKPRLSIIPACAADDRRLSAAQYRLLGKLGCYANPKTGWCWPSNTTLAKGLGVENRTVERHLRRLVAAGYIERQAKPGKTSGTRIIFDVEQIPLPFDDVTPDTRRRYPPTLSVGTPPTLGVDQNVPMNDPLNEFSSEPSSTSESNHKIQSPKGDNAQLVLSAPSQGTDPDISFEEWWQHWAMPGTKRNKGAAKRAYLRIVRKNRQAPQELVDGVKRYMVHCHRNAIPIQFIKHPGTWLNGQCWKDELIDDQPDNRKGNGHGFLKSPEQLARELADELAGTDQAFETVDGDGESDQRDCTPGPRHGNNGDGEDLPQIPSWFDQDRD